MNTQEIASVTDAQFVAETAPGTGFVAVEFSAEWCPPCKIMAPILEAAAQEFAPRVRFLTMDTDANPATMVKLGVRGLPTLLVFRDGEMVDRIVGAVPMNMLRERITRALHS
jgi:Thioredoxin domain-containing protein